jgi:hypothetical protein
MCRAFYIDGKRIETVGELAAAIGPNNVVWDSAYTGKAPDESSCLCPVHALQTAEKCGMDMTIGGFGDYVLTRREKP